MGGLSVTPFDAAAILIVLAAALGYINYRFLKLPSSIGLTMMGAIAPPLVVAIDRILPGADFARHRAVHRRHRLPHHADERHAVVPAVRGRAPCGLGRDATRAGTIIVLSTIGVALSTALIGGGFLLLSQTIGFDVPAIWCFVFGALISPTDPVSVMGVLKRANVSPVLEATVAGESLFNDGVGVGVVTIPWRWRRGRCRCCCHSARSDRHTGTAWSPR